MEKVFLAIITKMFGMTEAEAKTKFFDEKDGVLTHKPEAIELVYSLEIAKQKRIDDLHKAELTTIHDKGYNKAKVEALDKYETELKEVFGVQSDKKGKELHSEIREKISKGTGQMTDDQVRLHPEFLKMEKKYREEFVPKTEFETLQQKHNDFTKTVSEKTTREMVRKEVLKTLDIQDKPFMLPDDQAKREARIDIVVDRMMGKISEIQTTDGQTILIGRDGKRMETENKNPVKFGDLATSELELVFDRSEQSKSAGSGGAGKGDDQRKGTGSKYIGKMPKDTGEYRQIFATLKTTEEKNALATAWAEISANKP
jgi:hypothetical protein